MSLPISVVIPTYNLASFLPHCLESILQQTQVPREIIVVDDGSTDTTPEVVRQYVPRVTYIRKPNGGVASARNRGIQAANNEWIAFLDHDDIALPTRFEREMNLAHRTGCDLIFSDQTVLNTSSGVKASWFAKNGFHKLLAANTVLKNPREMLLRHGCFVPQPTVLARRDCLLDVGGYDESMPPADDYDLFLRLARKFSFAAVLEPLVLRRIHDRNLSRNRMAMIEATLRIYEKAGPDLRATDHDKWIAANKARYYRELGSLRLASGNPAAARRCYAASEHASLSCAVGMCWASTFLPTAWIKRLQGWRQIHVHAAQELDHD
jgi:glycosyltransferase involved in cell wall biosynthesis